MKLGYQKAIYLLSLIMLFGCGGETVNNTQVKPKYVKVVTVGSEESKIFQTFNGEVLENRLSMLSFRVGGPIIELYVQQGDYVNEGEIIAKIDERDFQIQFSTRKAQFEQLKGEYERYELLFNESKIPANDYEKIKSGYLMAKSAYQSAVNQLHDTELKAPFSGYINEVKTENFQTINPGQPVVSIVDMSKLEILVFVSENQINLINQNSKGFLSIDNINIKDIPVYVKNIGKKKQRNGLYEVSFECNNLKNNSILPGMSAEIKVNLYNSSSVINIPSTAIFNSNNSDCVWIYNSQNQIVQQRSIQISNFANNGMIEVKSGLNHGDIVVVAGVHSLTEGQNVQLIQKISETNIGGLL